MTAATIQNFMTASEAASYGLAASLAAAGIALLGGSDAPYACADPWLAMRSAVVRQTAGGAVLGAGQRLAPMTALKLYCRGKIAPGATADLILCEGTLADVLADLTAERLRLTLIGGRVAFSRAGAASIRQ